MNDKVTMRSPDGEIRNVDATPEALTPLMAAGWHQLPGPPVLQQGTKTEFPGAAKLYPAKPGDLGVLGVSEVK
jgi:hypothetical protein